MKLQQKTSLWYTRTRVWDKRRRKLLYGRKFSMFARMFDIRKKFIALTFRHYSEYDIDDEFY